MHLDNVAMVTAPNLFYNLPRTRDSAMDELTLANHSSHVVKLMLKYHRLLWTVSGGQGGLVSCVHTYAHGQTDGRTDKHYTHAHTHTHTHTHTHAHTAQIVSFSLFFSFADSRGNAESGAYVV